MGFVRYCHSIPFRLLFVYFMYVASSEIINSSELYNWLTSQHDDRRAMAAISICVMVYSMVEILAITQMAIARVANVKWGVISESNGIPATFMFVMYAIIRVSSQYLIDRTWQIFAGNSYFEMIYLCQEARNIVRASVSVQAAMVLCATICTMRYYIARDMIKPMKYKMVKEEESDDDLVPEDLLLKN